MPGLHRWYRAAVVRYGKRFAPLLLLRVGVAQANGHSSKPKPDGFPYMLVGQKRARTQYTTDVGNALPDCRILSIAST